MKINLWIWIRNPVIRICVSGSISKVMDPERRKRNTKCKGRGHTSDRTYGRVRGRGEKRSASANIYHFANVQYQLVSAI
jgi:hypothetical protein